MPTTCSGSPRSPPGWPSSASGRRSTSGSSRTTGSSGTSPTSGRWRTAASVVPIYQTSSAEQVAYILGHSEARGLLRRGPRACWPDPRGAGPAAQARRGSWCSRTTTVSTIRSWSASHEICADRGPALEREPDLFERPADAVRPTTARDPRLHERHDRTAQGAMVSHANIMWTIGAAVRSSTSARGERLLVVPPAQPRRRAHDQRLRRGRGRRRDLVRAQPVDRRGGPARLPPDVFFAVPRVLGEAPRGGPGQLGTRHHGLKKLVVDALRRLGRAASPSTDGRRTARCPSGRSCRTRRSTPRSARRSATRSASTRRTS